jgi:uncharacterized repeat protein (TIGR02543 family)
MRRFVAFMAVWLTVFCFAQVRAQRAYFDGNLQSNGTVCPVSGIIETVLQTRTGYFTDPSEPYPKTGDLAYVHAVATNVSSCVSDAPGFEFFLPDGASFAIDATNQVYCFLGNTNVTSSSCSQTPTLGLNGGAYFGFSALASGQTFEVQVPVVFNKKLLGLAGPTSHRLSILTSSAYGTVYAEQAVTTFYNASFQSLASGNITSSTADLAFTLNSYYNTGQLYVDFGTTTALGSSTTPASVPNTQQSFNPTVQLTGLTPATKYYWQARFATPDGTFRSNPIQSFTTAGGVPQTLTITKNGTGTGNVTSAPTGIDCGLTCSASFTQGTSVTLTAAPVVGSVFTGWTGACTGTGLTCTVVMNTASSVTASFSRELGSLDLSVTGLPASSKATLGVTGPDNYNLPQTITTGTGVNLSDVPTGVYTITAPDVIVNGTTYKPDLATRNLTVNAVGPNAARVVYTAVIVPTFALTVTKSGTGTGTVVSDVVGIDCGTTCNADFAQGSKVILIAKPDAGSSFTGWSGAGCGGTGDCTITMNAILSVNAEFSSNTLGALNLSVNGLPTGTSTKLEIVDQKGVSSTVTVLNGTSQQIPNLAPGKYEIRSPDVIVAGTTYTPDLTSQTVRVDAGLTSTVKITYKIQTPTFALTVTKNGTGTGGSISSNPAGIDCGATCTSSFDQNTVVILTATPAIVGSIFVGWSGDCTGTTTCTVTMNADKNVTANFKPTPPPVFDLNITIDSTGTGTGSISSNPAGINCGTTCTSKFTQGTSVTLTAAPLAGSSFVGWTGDCTGTGTCTITMDGAKNVTAKFNLIPKYLLTIAKIGSGSGTVSSVPAGIDCGTACAPSFLQGELVTLTATAASGSSFAGWTGDCTGTGACVVTMDAAKNVTATFNTSVVLTFALSVNRNGLGTGTVSSTPNGINCGGICTANFDQNKIVSLTAIADAGSSFAGWTGACTGLTTCSVTMDAAKTVTASFNLIPKVALTVTKSGTGTGSISSDLAGIDCGATCTSSFLQGKIVTLTASAASGSSFAGWTGDCTGTGACIVTMDAVKNVTATFNTSVVPTFALTVANVGAGSVSSNPSGINCGTVCTANFPQATSVVLTATAASGSSFAGWSGACTGTGTCTVTMDAIKNVTATFKTNVVPTFALTVTKSGSGTISSAPAGIDCGATCTSSFDQAKVVTLTATPAVGSSFTGWTGACTGTATCVVTMDAAKTVTATFTANPPANVASSKPSNAPADRMVMKGSSDNSALAFAFTLPGGSLSSITLNVSGSGNDATDLTNVKLYKDSNANGLVDAGEPMLASGKFLGNDGTLTLTPANVALLAASGATQFVVAVDVNNALAALRFAPVLGGLLLMGLGLRRRRWLGAVGLVVLLNSCQPPIPAPEIRTYQINLTAVTAKDSSNLAVNITGLPIAGATLSVEK